MKELKKQWKNNEFAPCYLFYGEEAYLIKNYEKALMEALLPKGSEMMNYDLLEEKRINAATIMDIAETFPFMNEKRLLTVRGSDFFKKGQRKDEGEKLVDFFQNLPDTICILFIEEKVEKNNRLYKAVTKAGQAIEFKLPSEKDLAVWIKRACKDAGVTMQNSVMQVFFSTVGADMETMQGELAKLISYKEKGDEISVLDIEEVCSPSLEAKVFDLVRAVAEKKGARAVGIYRNMLLLNESPYMVLSLMTRQFRLILESLLLSADGLTNQQIAEKIDVREFAVKEYIRQAKRFPATVWQEALRDCLETDISIKSGFVVEDVAVEVLIVKYANR